MQCFSLINSYSPSMYKYFFMGIVMLIVSSDTSGQNDYLWDDKGYELVFSDEFNLPDGSQPNPAIWSRKGRNQGTCNRWNSDSEKVVYIKNGSLVCRAIPNKSEPGDTAKMLTGAVWTYGKYEVKYGKIEVRMRTNNREGNFPAAWLKWVPVDWNTDPYAEIDIVEMAGNRGVASQTIHSQLTMKDSKHGQKNNFQKKLNVTKWHIYAVEWTPTYITFAIDGKPVGTYRKSLDKQLLDRGQWTFDVPCYIVLNQALGDGKYVGMSPRLKSTYETRFDWIRVYQKKRK